MTRPSHRTLQQRLSEGVVLGAEGYVFELERRGYIQAGPFVPEVILDEPDALRQLHRDFLRAGSDVMVALTYYAHRDKLSDVGRGDDLEELNRQAVRIANEIAAEGGALVAGNICNTWAYDPKEPEASGAVVRAQYEEQLGWAVQEGVDFVIAETNDYLGEARSASRCARSSACRPWSPSPACRTTTYDGYDYVEACRILADPRSHGRRPQLLAWPRRRCSPCSSGSARRSTSRWRPSPSPTAPRRRRRPSRR